MRKLCLLLVGFLALYWSPAAAYEGIHGAGLSQTKLNYDSLYREATPLDRSPEGRALIENCIEAYGGEEHLAGLQTLALEYQMTTQMSADTAEVRKYWAGNRQHKAVSSGFQFTKERIICGDEAWRVVNDTVTNLQGGDYCGQLFSYLALAMPRALTSELFSEIRFGRHDDDSLAYLFLRKADSLTIAVGIDPTDLMIKSIAGIIPGNGHDRVYLNLLDDYRDVSGYLLPYSLINISLGLEVGRSGLVSVEINPVLSDKLFRPSKSDRDEY